MDRNPSLRRFGQFASLCLAFMLTACGGGGSSGDSAGTSNGDGQDTDRVTADAQTAPDGTMAILESIYLNERTPDGFYTEPDPAPDVYQSISHLKNTDTADPSSITPDTPRYELCAGGFDQALQWSIDAGETAGELVDNRDTDLFYEFTRVPAGSPERRNLQRVFKCSMLDRSDIDLNNPDGFLGLYTELPQSADRVKTLIEYLWTFTDANNYGNAVLASRIEEAETRYIHTLEQARLTPAAQTGDASSCDRIDVYATRYRVAKLTGSISVTESLEQTLFGRYENGIIETCDA